MMIIEIGNSYSKVVGFDKETYQRLREALSYETDPNARYFAGGLYPSRRCLMDRHGSFPTGLLDRVRSVIPKAKVLDTRKRPMVRPYQVTYAGPPLREEQIKSAYLAVKLGRAGIEIPTGVGKSLIIALTAASLGVKTLIVVPNLTLKEQLKKSLRCHLKGNIDFITVENIDSPRLMKYTGFDALIIDEAHHVAASTYRELNKTVWKDIYYRVFLTATFYRNQEHEGMLFEGISGPVSYRMDYKTARDKGYILPVEGYTVNTPKIPTDAHTWAQVYSELVVNNGLRNAKIAELMSSLEDRFTLTLVKEIKHGDILSQLTGAPFANGQTEGSDDLITDFCSGNLKHLIATTGVCGEGTDCVPAEYIIIAGLGKAKSAFMQQVGRGVRLHSEKESCKVILFRDASHKYTLRHFNAQAKILLEEYGVKPMELDI